MHPEIAALATARGLDSSIAHAFDLLLEELLVRRSTIVQTEIDLGSAMTPEEEHVVAELPARYEDLGLLGVGGMGEVRRVRDRQLGRICALKIVKSELLGRPALLDRFVEEAQVASQLQHPNIAPIYDLGRLADGRPWFTMKEIRGRTLTDDILDAHDRGLDGPDLRRLMDAFASVCDGVGYGHSRGVVHRDLKPDNVMIGAHGEVLILDWGLAKVGKRPDAQVDVASTDGRRTAMGTVLGTPCYMPPEQARGANLDARADVYALGSILYEVLTGEPPFVGPDAVAVLRQVLAGPPVAVAMRAARPARVPEVLAALCQSCMARDPDDRPSDGTAVAERVRAWLDGVDRRERALHLVHRADALAEQIRTHSVELAALAGDAEAMVADVPGWAPESEKLRGWSMLDACDAHRRVVRALEIERDADLRSALSHAPDLAEAHERLLAVELARHAEARAARDIGGLERGARLIQEHAAALPANNPVAVSARARVRGEAFVRIVTDPPDARIDVYRFESVRRRLVPIRTDVVGVTGPLEAVLPIGSYVAEISNSTCTMRYPFLVEHEPWSQADPDGQIATARVPGSLGPDDCAIPAGWFQCGGDPDAVDALRGQRVWLDAFIIKRFPVTNREYIHFLNDLVNTGRTSEALAHQPRERATSEGDPIFRRTSQGRFELAADRDGDVWDPDFPVMLVDWYGACAYAEWLGAKTGLPWRLPSELEWEKAARGVDGRFFPWGDSSDPSWCCLRASHRGRPLPARVDSFPVDVSVYGVRGLAGNIQDWCADPFLRHGPRIDARGRVHTTLDRTDALRPFRGGYWYGAARNARAAVRSGDEPTYRNVVLGFRVARSEIKD